MVNVEFDIVKFFFVGVIVEWDEIDVELYWIVKVDLSMLWSDYECLNLCIVKMKFENEVCCLKDENKVFVD